MNLQGNNTMLRKKNLVTCIISQMCEMNYL